MRIVTVTMNPAIDKSAGVQNVMPESKMRCSPPTFEPGGGGINVSRAIKKLGGESQTYYTCGGHTGELLRELLDEEELEHHSLPIEEPTRQNFTVFEESTNREYRFGLPGPRISAGEIDHVVARLAALDPVPDFAVMSGSLPPGAPVDFYARAAQALSERGAAVVVDTSGDPLQSLRSVPLLFIKPNIRELGQMAGRPLEGESDITAFARELIDEGMQAVIVSLGAGGAILVSDDVTEKIAAPTVRIRSKIGAGDSMVAGVVRALSQGRPMQDAARYGVAAGAAAVMTPGTNLCRYEDTERLYETINNLRH
ncbi:MAG: 1-phosphofructokinase family hexose kinase [Anaerolineae bacterium]